MHPHRTGRESRSMNSLWEGCIAGTVERKGHRKLSVRCVHRIMGVAAGNESIPSRDEDAVLGPESELHTRAWSLDCEVGSVLGGVFLPSHNTSIISE